jgi:hypothetical protein
VPVAILLGWGTAFLTSCIVALSAGGVPIIYRLDTPGGLLTARADSYRWSIPRNTLQLRKLEITDPDGLSVARVGELLLSDFVPGQKPVQVRLRDVFVRLERKADGHFRLEEWMPAEVGEPSEVAYTVDAGRVSVLWDDFAGRSRWRKWVSTPRLRLDGRGAEWIASGRLKLEDAGYLSARIASNPESGITGDLRFHNLDVAGLVRRFADMPESRDLPEIRDVRVASSVVQGHLRFRLPPEKPVVLAGRLRASTDGFRFGPDIAAEQSSIDAVLTNQGVRGQVVFADRKVTGSFSGVARWEPDLLVSGSLLARADRSGSLPNLLRASLPKGLDLRRPSYDGWIDYRPRGGWAALGDVAAESLNYEGEQVRQVVARLSYQSDQLLLADLRGAYAQNPVTGDLQLNLRTQTLRGQVSAARVNVADVARRFGLPALEGRGEARLAMSGTVAKPVLELRATGNATSRELGYDARLGRFELVAGLAANQVTVDRLTVVGPSGTAYALGKVDLRDRSLDFDVLATSVPLGNFFEAIEASAAFSGTVRGTFENPIALGQLELFGAQAAGQTIPYARGDVEIDRRGLSADQVLAFKRGATARGEFGLTFGNQALTGNFTTTGVNLSDYPPEGVSGIARVTRATLAGTLESPVLSADVTADTLVVANVRFGDVTAKARIEGRTLYIEEASAASDTGSLKGSGTFSLDDVSGTFDVEADQFALAPLLREVPLDLAVEGSLDGRAQGSFADGKLKTLSSDGQISGLRVNQAFLGNGPLVVKGEDGIWEASLFLGDLNSYLELPSMIFDQATNQIKGEVVANNFDIQLLYQSFERYLVDADGASRLPEDLREKLATTSGELDLSAQLSGNVDNMNVEVPTLSLNQLNFEGQDAGDLQVKGRRENRVWTLDQFEWQGGPALVKLNRARIDEHGEIEIDGEVNDLRWAWFAPLYPGLASVRGETDFPFLVTGMTRSPEIRASLSYEERPPETVITPWPSTRLALRDARARTRRIDLDTISIEAGEINASGAYNFDGFTGPIEAKIPFNYPFEIPADREIFARVSLPERPLNSLTDFLPGLDVNRTEGSVRGEVEVRGLRDALKVTGLAEARAKEVAWQGFATALRDFKLDTSFNGESVAIRGSAIGSDGGSLSIEDAGLKLDNLSEAFSSTFDTLLGNQLYGSFKLNDFKMVYQDPKEGAMSAALGGNLSLNGTVRTPEISGQLLISEVNAAPPSTLAQGGPPRQFPIDPRFNVSLLATDSMRMRLSTGTFFLGGSGQLSGQLSSPDFTSTLVVERGSIRLPNARINIEPGGEIAITYRPGPNGTNAARAELNMVGRTQVSAESYTGNVERYDVILNITGDLLQEGGLQLTAQSDPPDLSQERILMILGQGDVLGSRRGEAFRADRQLQSALIGIALPYVAGGLTERLADQLGLDYLNIEYNTFDRLSVTAAMSLGRDIVLSGRRQLSEPYPGEKAKYEVRLSYRPPFRNRALRRFSISIGTDQDRPWKIMIEYGFRF